MLKQQLIEAHDSAIRSIKNQFELVPMEKTDCTPHKKAMDLGSLLKHLQTVELRVVTGIVNNLQTALFVMGHTPNCDRNK